MEEYVRHPFTQSVPHYYGDIVRQLFICTAALMLIAAPFYADSLRVELPFEIAGALVLVALAALVNPHKKSVMVANAVASGVGLVIFETWTLYAYQASSWVQVGLRQLLALLFLVAFYFSVKTVRAFVMHQVGRQAEAGEFEDVPSLQEDDPVRRTGVNDA